MSIFIYILFLFCSVIFSSEPFEKYKKDKSYFPNKINDNTIIINGLIEDREWENAKIINDFTQASPHYGSEPTRNSNVRVLYDNEAIYIAAYLFDESDKIKKKISAYDNWQEGFDNNADYFVIEIDCMHDHQTSYAFAVNSSGVKADYKMFNDASLNEEWDEMWYAKTSIQNDGWIVEYKIPLKILNYHKNEDMGINFIRYIQRNNEYIYWVLLPIEFDGIISHYGHIKDLSIPIQKNITIQPYILHGGTNFINQYYAFNSDYSLNYEDLLEYNYKKNRNRFGIDIKYNINNHSMIEYSFNPDFGQIEQHPSEINLTSYEIYYDEKRPFFTNNASVFYTPINIFYSRRIGGNLISDDYAYETLIKNALQVTGKQNRGISYGILLSDSKIEKYDDIDSDKRSKYFISRIRKDILEGNSYVGFMGTKYKDSFITSNVSSFDFLINFLNNKLKFDGQSVVSRTDSSKVGWGHSYEISYTDKIYLDKFKFFNNNVFDTWVNVEYYNKNFNINHAGYLERNNLKKLDIGIAFTKESANRIIIQRSFNIRSEILKNFKNDILGNFTSFNWQTDFSNYWYFDFTFLKSLTHYDDWISHTDHYISQDSIIVKKPSSNEFKVTFGSSPLNKWSFNYQLRYFESKNKDIGSGYDINLIYKPMQWLNVEFNYELDRYNEKYHFLKIRKYIIIPEPPSFDNDISRNDERDNYYFSDSEIFERNISLLTSAYISNSLSLKLYLKYFTFINDYPNYYYVLEDNYNYPTLIENISDEVKEEDGLLYSSNYSNIELNYILKWEFDKKINLHVIYSVYKGVVGKRFNTFKELLNYKINENTLMKTEVFYDKSVFIKLDFLLNS